MVGQEPLHRRRKKHTRSRTGCVPCRERHVRCDETRPGCANCMRISRECQYPDWGQDIVDRATKTKLPGVQAPWQMGPVMALATVAVADPFDTLPIEMPFRSMELLRYFFTTKAASVQGGPTEKTKIGLSMITNDPIVCRSTVVFAGLHYAGSYGGLHALATSFFHHKLQCISDIKGWVSNSEKRITPDCLRLIGTLCISEICLGNISTATAQVAGLVTLAKLRKNQKIQENALENELLERYTLMIQCLVELKREMALAFAGMPHASDEGVDQSLLGNKAVLDILRLLPYFVNVKISAKPRPINVNRIIKSLRAITLLLTAPMTFTGAGPPDIYHAGELITSMTLASTDLHIQSVSEKDEGEADPPGSVVSSWKGMCAASILYVIEGPLTGQRAGMPTQLDTLSYLFRILRKDLDSTMLQLEDGKYNRDLWLWKAFGSFLAMAKAQKAYPRSHASFGAIQRLKDMACYRVKWWTQVTQTTEWERVEEALYRVVWGDGIPEEEARKLWKEVLRDGQ
ncbi:hypothetical protein GQ53DRAFT_465426 [Thozetella sp. PMI_491]|nr:hypothetical protein GQ53DRAFT_465426 [Thozetella sp. PMI_491]